MPIFQLSVMFSQRVLRFHLHVKANIAFVSSLTINMLFWTEEGNLHSVQILFHNTASIIFSVMQHNFFYF